MNLDDLDTLVMDADPALHAAIPSASSAEAHWDFMQITMGEYRDRQRQRRVRVTVRVGAVVAAALAVVLGIVIPGPSGPQSAAAAVLEKAATSARLQNDSIAPGQYLYKDIGSLYQIDLYRQSGTGVAVQSATAQFTETEQVWLNAGGTGSVRRTESALRFPTASDRAIWNADPAGQQIFRAVAGSSALNAEQAVPNVSNLPTAPNRLASVIANGQLRTNIDLIPKGPNSTFERAAALLIGPDAGMSPALASALFEVLANQPGTSLLGNVTDHSGQRGEGVVLKSMTNESASEIVVDPDSGSLLEALFSPPPVTLPAGEGQACVSSGSGTPACSQSTVQAVLSPVWTDLVATGTVGSSTATLPPSPG
jgi:hypothetical protein